MEHYKLELYRIKRDEIVNEKSKFSLKALLIGIEPMTPRLTVVCSNQLS